MSASIGSQKEGRHKKTNKRHDPRFYGDWQSKESLLLIKKGFSFEHLIKDTLTEKAETAAAYGQLL